MATAKTAAELVTAMDATTRDLENWIARLDLSTTYHQPERGLPRLFTRLNALEMALIAALVRGGATPAKAGGLSRLFVLDARYGRLANWKQWFVFPAGKLERGIGTDQLDAAAPSIRSLNATTLSIVNIKELVRRVDDLFSEAN